MMLFTVSIAAVLFLAACSSGAAATPLRCPDCPVVGVIRVIDGDTFESTSGTVNGSIATVRLFGVDAPERGQPCSIEATERLRELLGSSTRVQEGPRLVDPYGRLLRYVYTESGQSIDAALIEEGLAAAWTRDGQHREYLVDMEEEAKGSRIGCIW
jgi:endonuclease YncB( thermonuclease family)